MKKILALLTLLVLVSVTACDDGEMTVQSFNFTGTPTACTTQSNVYIKTTGSEVLILNLASSPLLNIEGTRTVALAAGTIKYRNYNTDSGLASVVCSTLDSPDAYVLEEWTGSGSIEIVTTKLPVAETDGIIKYSHSITFTDVSLSKGNETIRIEGTDFGSITTTLKIKFRFASATETPTQLLACGNQPYTYNSDYDALRLVLADGTFDGVEGESTVTLSSTNYLSLRHYTSSLSSSVLCSTNAPIVTVDEAWQAIQGEVKLVKTIETVGGISQMVYDIYLRDVVFFNITSSAVLTETFRPVNNYTDSEGVSYYYLGQYKTEL